MPPELDLTTLIQEHQVGIWRYLRVLGCDASQAEDLTQETFLAVLEKPFENINRSATAAYLRTVARNLYISALRRSNRTAPLEELDLIDAAWAQLSGNDGGDAIMVALDSCLQSLDERSRQSVEMQFRDRLSRAEIAANLEMSEDGAKNLLQRTKKRLRACIERKLNVFQR